MRIIKHKPSALNQIGDTIVEVLISMTILTLVLTVTYVSVSHSLRSGIDSSNRQQALSLAQQQVEIIKSAAANNQAVLSVYQTAGDFCIIAANVGAAPQYGRTNGASCNPVAGTLFDIIDTYTPGAPGVPGLFTINATWLGGPSGNTTSQLTLYYR